MLQIKNITITHKEDLRTMIENLSFTLLPGDKAAIIGEEGNGKSTLLKLIYGEASISDYAEYSGEILRNGKKLGYLPQELLGEEKELTVLEFCEASENFYFQMPGELSRIAGKLGLKPSFFYSSQKVGSLSGGERVKLSLARLFFDEPEILLLDEPSNDLDLETLSWLEQFICESTLPILYISHDELLLERTANKIIHLEQVERKKRPRSTVCGMGYREYLSFRLAGFAKQEQNAKKEKSELEKKLERYRKIEQKVEHRQNTNSRQDPHTGQLLKKKMHAVKAMGRRFEKEKEALTKLPEMEEAIFIRFPEEAGIPAGKTVLNYELSELKAGEEILSRGLRLLVTGPERIAIIGKNGVGKTTLLRKIAEELLVRKDIKAAYMPQNYEELLPMEKTPVAFLTRTGEKEEAVKICTYLGSMKFTREEMEYKIGHLSGGQKAKLSFLKMSMEKANVLILDEPTRNFSPLSNPVIRKMLSSFPGTVISVSHDRKYIEEVCNTVYELTQEGLLKI